MPLKQQDDLSYKSHRYNFRRDYMQLSNYRFHRRQEVPGFQLCHPIVLFCPFSYAVSTVEPQKGHNSTTLSQDEDWVYPQNEWIPEQEHSLITHNAPSYCQMSGRIP